MHHSHKFSFIHTLAITLALGTLALGACGGNSGYFPVGDAGTEEPDLAPDPNPAASLPASTKVSVILMPGPGMTPIVNAIKGAKTSVDLTVYFLSDSGVINALIAAKNAGRTVRVVLEDKPDSLSNLNAYNQLNAAGVQVRWGDTAFNFVHTKAMIIDGAALWAMTMNLASSAPSSNREHIAVVTDPEDVADARALFEADWNKSGAPAMQRLVVSPITSRLRLNQLIDAARSELLIEWELLSDNDIVTHINQRLKAGVKVQIIVPDRIAGSQTEAMSLALKAGGAEVRTLGTPDVHTKMILVDRVTGYIGSINATANSLDRNRELGVIWRDAAAVQTVLGAFQKDFAAGKAL